MRKLPLTAAEELPEIIMRRYERASTMLTSNRLVEDWGKLLGDAAAVSAMLDRLLHHGHVLKCGPAELANQNRFASTGGGRVEQLSPGRLLPLAVFEVITEGHKRKAMKHKALVTDLSLPAIPAVLILLATTLLFCQGCAQRTPKLTPGKLPEELVRVQAKDGIPNGGVIYTPLKNAARPIAIIWIHGWGANFYSPTYVNICRALAERGYTCIAGNTRMHDLGNVEWIGDKRIRGGGYWGVASEQVRDIAAWIDFAEDRGFKQVVLVGHSAGWAAVTQYEAETQDRRVVGVVVASGSVHSGTGPTDPDQIAQATRMMADGHPDDLVRDPKRSFPSFVSAATMLDIVNSPPEFRDFYGTQTETKNPGVTRIHCQLLAFYGTKGDVGDASELELLKSSIQRQSNGPSRVTTVMIKGGDHEYVGEEAQVAETIAKWADTLGSSSK